MTPEQAIRILDSETSLVAIEELKYYAGFNRDKVIDQIQEAMDMGAEALRETMWIPCSKMMPKNQTAVLICLEWNAYDIAWLDGDLWVSELTVYDFETVMAWMPLPPAFEGE